MRKLFKRNPEAVLNHALLLARETAILQRTVEKAGQRIMELEVAAALGPAGGRSEEGQAARGAQRHWGKLAGQAGPVAGPFAGVRHHSWMSCRAVSR